MQAKHPGGINLKQIQMTKIKMFQTKVLSFEI